MQLKQIEKRSRVKKEEVVAQSSTSPEIDVNELSDAMKLPSKFLPYPKNCSIKFRPYTFGEIKVYNQSKLNAIDNIKFVLKGITCSFDSLLLTVSDFLYIGLLRRLATFGGSKFSLAHICKHCKERQTELFDNSSIEFQDIIAPALPARVNLSVGKLEFTPITLKDYIFILEENKQSDDIALMAVQCRNKPFDEAYELIYNLSSTEGAIIDKVDKSLYHSIKPLIFKCSKCGEKNSIAVEGGTALIYPFRDEREKPIEDVIHFGL